MLFELKLLRGTGYGLALVHLPTTIAVDLLIGLSAGLNAEIDAPIRVMTKDTKKASCMPISKAANAAG